MLHKPEEMITKFVILIWDLGIGGKLARIINKCFDYLERKMLKCAKRFDTKRCAKKLIMGNLNAFWFK